jgi:hypothetical protein
MALIEKVNKANLGTDFADYGIDNNYWQNAYSWEPKKAHQFIMEIDGIPAYLIHSSAKPSIENNEITLDHMNVQRYVKGKSKWSSISITLYDPIVPSAAQAVMDWVRLHHESATGRDGYSSMYKKEITLTQLSPLGEKIEEWILKGAFITSAKFGDLDWSSEDVVKISMDLRYDWAFLNF